MLEEIFGNYQTQLQVGLIVLLFVMGSLLWRMHRQVRTLASTSRLMGESLGTLEQTTKTVAEIATASTAMRSSLVRLEETTEVVGALAETSTAMQDTLARLESATGEITRRTEETEETLRSNLEEYRMALGSTNAYREYLQRMGLAPAADVEPILEAIADGAEAVGADGRVLYANRAFADLTTVSPGATLDEVAARCRVRSFQGEALDAADLPESRVLAGESVTGELIRIRPPGRDRDLILSVNGQPARDAKGTVVAAVMLCREVSEEIAMAIEVRRLASQREWDAPPMQAI
jgi:ABC-type transporter Mla subunit MlaD